MANADRATNGLRWPFRAILMPAAVLALCGACRAHELSPTHYPLGPYPVGVLWESPAFAPVIVIPIVVVALVLRWGVPKVPFAGHLWRSAVVYVVARSAEFAALFASPYRGWPGLTVGVALEALALVLVGAAAAAITMRLLYGPIGRRRIIGLACAVTFVGYASGLGTAVAIAYLLW